MTLTLHRPARILHATETAAATLAALATLDDDAVVVLRRDAGMVLWYAYSAGRLRAMLRYIAPEAQLGSMLHESDAADADDASEDGLTAIAGPGVVLRDGWPLVVATTAGGAVTTLARTEDLGALGRTSGLRADAGGATVVRVFYGTNRARADLGDLAQGFSGERDPNGAVHYGACDVTVPKSHKVGSTGSSWWNRLVTLSDDRLKLQDLRSADEAGFWAQVAARIAAADAGERQALVYLHGYRNTFEDAAIRAAQLAFDLKVPGAMAFFSWPSRGTTQGYPADEAAVEASEAAITDFLTRFATGVGAETVHVIAHSMGNRGLLRAMQRISAAAAGASPVRFGQIFLAAPDVDAGVFANLATHYHAPRSARTTIYASPGDKAVGLSKWLHGAPRVGFTPPVTVVNGIDTVVVPDFDVDALGHGYYAAARGVLDDLRSLLLHDDPPHKRLLDPVDETGGRHWRMRR